MPENSEEADQAAMARLCAGDDLALNEIMERWKRPLISYLYRWIGHEHEAADLAQETFVRIYEKRLVYRPEGKFSSWLWTIATNLGRNQKRWHARHPQVSLEDAPDFPAGAATPDQSSMKAELARRLQAGVQELPSDLRTAFLLFEYEEQSYEDIAAITGCSRKAVETRLYRARHLLREKLQGFWP
jgi:RNA polymerase sigma-70 factor (ECF subfamily)